jgi:DHA2 family multidrug resistance protein-like MFS transporter
MWVGLMIGAAGFVILARAGVSAGLAAVAVGSALWALGSSPAFTLANDLIIAAAPPERAGAAAGISETSAELGGALGIALLGSLGTVTYRSRMEAAALPGIPRDLLAQARGTLGGAAAAASGGRLSAPDAAGLLREAHEAFVASMSLVSVICAVLVVATAIVTAVLLRRA